jgi:hypothetical protein
MKPIGAGVLVALAVFAASRLQLPSGGPGVMVVTIPLPALVLLLISLVAARAARSFRAGLVSGAWTLLACFIAVSAVVAVEGLVWMQTWGVFILDGDPPLHAVGAADVALDFFTTGLWLGHVAFWLPWLFIGAGAGCALASSRRLAPTAVS